jgi:hypothetical protein
MTSASELCTRGIYTPCHLHTCTCSIRSDMGFSHIDIQLPNPISIRPHSSLLYIYLSRMAQNHSKCKPCRSVSADRSQRADLYIISPPTADTLAHATPSLDQRNASETHSTKEQKNSFSAEVQEQMQRDQCEWHDRPRLKIRTVADRTTAVTL